MDRRTFLSAAGAAAATGLLPLPTAGAADATPPPFVPDVDIELAARPDLVEVLPGAPTQVWRYEARVLTGPDEAVEAFADRYVGPVLRLKRGQRVRIRYLNRIPEPSIVHWHGLIVPAAMDGHPRDVVAPSSGEYVYEFEVRNRAGTYWFHPHPHGLTGSQVYRGLAGMLIVSDEDERDLGLPAEVRDLPMVISDRLLGAGNELLYFSGEAGRRAMGPGMMAMMTGFAGDRTLVNGRPTQTLRVGADPHRIRLLNGANARIYRIARSDGRPLIVIGTDGGLVERPESRDFLVLAPGERVDLYLDFAEVSVGSRIALSAQPLDIGGMGGGMGGMGMGRGRTGGPMMGRGMMGGGMMGRGSGSPGAFGATGPSNLVVFDIVSRGGAHRALPQRFPPLPAVRRQALATRRFALTMQMMQWGINGRTYEPNVVADDERIAFGDTEIWVFENRSAMMAMPHPMHVHGVQFRLLDREGGDYGELRAGMVDSGLKDTVLLLPGERVRVAIAFQGFRGVYLYHCHNLEHEDMGMMRNFEVM